MLLDAGALIAFEKGDPRVRALLREILSQNRRVVVPAPVLAQVWRRPSEQVAVRSLTGSSRTEIVPLDGPLAEAVGVLCGRTRTRDVVDATVAIVARKLDAVVVTSDPDDLRALDGALALIVV